MSKIKSIFLKIAIGILKILYAIIKCFPTTNKVTFISRQSNTITIDFMLLEEELNKQCPDIKTVILTKKLESKLAYIFHMFKQMYLSLIHI